MQHLDTDSKKKTQKLGGKAKEVLSNEANPSLVKSIDYAARDERVKQYIPYATSIAAKILRSLSTEVDFDDVLSNAKLGLIEAAERFDASQNVDFKTFAYYRIRGAIFDGLRKTGWLPRSLYAKLKFEQAANDYLETQSNTGSADFFEKELKEVKESMNTLASVYVMSVDASEDMELVDLTADKKIEERVEFEKVKSLICDCIESLPDTERKLIKMYYFRGLTLEEAGEALGLSKSWVSRLHTRSLELLFQNMKQKNTGSADI